MATTTEVAITKPMVPAATVEVVGEPSGPFAPAPGAFPRMAEQGLDFSFRMRFTPPPRNTWPADRTFSGSVVLRFHRVGSELALDVVVNLQATIEDPGVRLETTFVDFGNTAVDETVFRSIVVENPNEVTAVDVTGVSGLGGDFSLAPTSFPVTVQPGARRSFTVMFHPQAEGAQATSVQVQTSLATLSGDLSGAGIPSELTVDLGFVPVLPGGETDWVEIEVGPEAAALHFEIVADDPRADFLLIGFEGPGGVVYENDTLTGPYDWLQNFPLGFGALFLQLPNSDALDVQLVRGGGTYRLRLLELSPFNAGYRIRAIVEQRNRGRVSTGVVPLNVFIAPGLPFTSGDAAGDPKLQTALQTMDDLLGQRGLRVGEVSYFQLADSALDDIGSEAELEDLLAMSAAAPEPRLNLFLVSSFSGTFGDGLLGVSGAAPGVKRNGTVYSGVAVAFDADTGPVVGSTAAHECGHYLGLFHTAHFDDFGFVVGADPIGDTPVCPFDGTTEECPTEGDDNLLWPFDLGSTDLDLTPGQGVVIRAHPLVDPGAPGLALSALAGNEPAETAGLLPVEAKRSWCANCAGWRHGGERPELSKGN
jgi:hypothetical protein